MSAITTRDYRTGARFLAEEAGRPAVGAEKAETVVWRNLCTFADENTRGFSSRFSSHRVIACLAGQEIRFAIEADVLRALASSAPRTIPDGEPHSVPSQAATAAPPFSPHDGRAPRPDRYLCNQEEVPHIACFQRIRRIPMLADPIWIRRNYNLEWGVDLALPGCRRHVVANRDI
jgi:hypothetical protein